MKEYRCKICGYIHKGKLEDEFNCPICGVDSSMFEEIIEPTDRIPFEEDNPSVTRINDKCINCGMCTKTCRNTTGIEYDIKTHYPICINCGSCRMTCPAGAICEKYCYKDVDEFIKQDNKIVVALTAPAVRVSLGEEFGLEPGTFVEGKLVSALKELGFDYVFDVTFGADLTTVEEANELIERLNSKTNLPMFTSCCPSWVKYMEMYHPNKLGYLSTCKSPISMQTAIIKNYFAELKGLNKQDIITVAIAPCTAKKYEASRNELNDTDYVITTSELALYLKESNINFNTLENKEFDSMFGKGSGAGTIFGTTGGVCESALRTAHYFLTGTDSTELLEFNQVRGMDGIKEATIKINDKEINVAVVNGLKNVFPILEDIELGKEIKYDFIEVMTCTGGCIAGGGQPLSVIAKLNEVKEKRSNGLYNDDKESILRYSYKNNDILNLYKNYLGEYGSAKAHLLLHTNYIDKSEIVK